MRIVVTGGLGHLGSALFPELSASHDVVILDNFLTNRHFSLFLLPHPVRMVEGDIRTHELNTLFKGVDVVIHLAAITDAPSTINNREETFLVNYEGTRRVVDACRKNGCRLIFPSTTSVYGVSDGVVDEVVGELNPQSPYAESKMEAEKYALDYERATVLRCGTVYGVSNGMRFHTACQKLTLQSILGQPLSVWKTAVNQKRPYLGLEDLIRAVQWVIDNNLTGLYCLVSQNSTIGDIVDILRRYRPDLQIEMTDNPILNQYSYEVSNQKMLDTGFDFRCDLETGLSDIFSVLGGVNAS